MMASLKTSIRPSRVLALHSTYFKAPIFLANSWPFDGGMD